MTAADARHVSTGLAGLDDVLDDLRIGDNVVWRVSDHEDYRFFVTPFVEQALTSRRSIIYARFGDHTPLVAPRDNVSVVQLDAFSGFEAFTTEVYRLVTDHGRGAFYVFDCLSDLLSAWATDVMVGQLFRVICPRLYELDTVAYFSLLARRHSYRTMATIRSTTQVLVDVRRVGGERYVQPVKAWQRSSPTMFLPHRQRAERLEPVTDSSDVAFLQKSFWPDRDDAARELDYWDRLFLDAAEHAGYMTDTADRQQLIARLCTVLFGRDERVLELARRHFDLTDLLALRERMIGSGFIGGKAAGMLIARKVLINDAPDVWAAHLDAHDSFFVGTDVYYSWLVHNGWWPRIMRQRTAEGYFDEAATLHADMQHGELPPETRPALERMLEYFGQYPILVRSSSLLEDGFGNAFAGKYDSVFCVNQGSPEERYVQLEQAILRVFASTMSRDALVYRRQRDLDHLEERMALLLQRVNGRYHDRYYLPDAAGVAVSRNLFAWAPDMDPTAGMVRMVVGLGTRAVDRDSADHASVIALDQPHRRPYSDEQSLRYTQHDADVLDITANRQTALPVRELAAAAPGLPIHWCAERERLPENYAGGQDSVPVWRINFRRLLDDTQFVPLMQQLLGTLESAYDYPVDVEYTLHIAPEDGTVKFNLVQCRPLQTLGSGKPVSLPEHVDESRILFANQGQYLGGSMDLALGRVITVDAAAYAQLSSAQKHAVARLVGHCNRDSDRIPTMLIGPGRWGSSSPELGVPIRFADISRAAVLVEVAEMNDRVVPELSFGSHFFQDLVEAAITYVALDPGRADTSYRPGVLHGATGTADRDADAAAGADTQSNGNDTDPAVAAAVRVFQFPDSELRLLADVRSRRMLCYLAPD
jgi:pyruvate, water dikinase